MIHSVWEPKSTTQATQSVASGTSPRELWAMALWWPALMLVCQTMCVWSMPWWLGELSWIAHWFALGTTLMLLWALPATIYYAFAGVWGWKNRSVRWSKLSCSAACAMLVILSIVSAIVGARIRHRAFVAAVDPGNTIVNALTEYRATHGRYPRFLEELVPAHLESLPYTGMIGYPNFEYRKDHQDIEDAPGEYELRISCPSGGINFDRFIYWPSENYPDRIQDNWVERIRGWAYVHE